MTAQWTSPAALGAMREAAKKGEVTEKMAKAAHAVLADYFNVTFTARVSDFISEDIKGADRSEAIAALRAADDRGWDETLAVIAAAIAAALEERR